VTAINVGGRAAWLVEGVAAPPPVAGVVVADTLQRSIRLTDNPEVIVRHPPRIYID
jgi:hypothetical protein